MRLTTETVNALAALIGPLDTEETREAYRLGRFPRADKVRDLDKRYRWDLFLAAKAWSVLTERVTDEHLDTALRRIVSPL